MILVLSLVSTFTSFCKLLKSFKSSKIVGHLGVVYSQWLQWVCFVIFTSFAILMPYLPLPSPLLGDHFTFPSILSPHAQPVCAVSGQLYQKRACQALCEFRHLPLPLSTWAFWKWLYLSFFPQNKLQNNFNQTVLEIWTKEAKGNRGPGSQLSLLRASGEDPTRSSNPEDAPLGLLCPWEGISFHDLSSNLAVLGELSCILPEVSAPNSIQGRLC